MPSSAILARAPGLVVAAAEGAAKPAEDAAESPAPPPAPQALVDDAAADGVGLCAKSGFRSRAEQIELRRAHCGTSDHAVFDAPPSSCSPPTGPGTSNHETGLAVDFSCADGQPMTHASPCFQWLAGHASAYGLHNLPSEPWHWSVTGR